jgi:hypothetical protein
MTRTFQILGYIGLIFAVAFPLYSQADKYTHPMQPSGWVQDERKSYPFVVTGAGFAVFGGLCFLSAAVVNSNRRSQD